MGRPRKNQTLTTLTTESVEKGQKITTYQAETLNESTPDREFVIFMEKPIELKNLALSIVKNSETGQWMLVQSKFDYKTNTNSKWEVIEQHTDLSEITHRFKVVFGETFMVPT